MVRMVIESVEGRWDSLTAQGEHFLGEIQLFLRQKRKEKKRKEKKKRVFYKYRDRPVWGLERWLTC